MVSRCVRVDLPYDGFDIANLKDGTIMQHGELNNLQTLRGFVFMCARDVSDPRTCVWDGGSAIRHHEVGKATARWDILG